VNKENSSKDLSSSKEIKFDATTLLSISNKVKEHNKKHPNKKITYEAAKAVVRRGMGAYSSSHRPTIKGGKPNSRVAWGLARLNAFLYKVVNGKSKSGNYSQDNDLMDELHIPHKKYADGGEILLAPNGKPSNLNKEQWHLVRTPAFKKWFGDWENDPENSSKVVDENGEPMVVYHGSRYGGINIFDIRQSKRQSSGLKEYGSFFTTNKNVAELYRNSSRYTKEADEQRIKEIAKLEKLQENVKNNREFNEIQKEIDKWYSKVYPVFLNIRKIKQFDAKLGTNKDGYNNLQVNAGYKWANGNDAIEFLRDGKFGVEKVDGIRADNVVELMQKTNDWQDYVGTSFLVFNETPKNIKLADGSNTTFDANNPDIRYAKGGKFNDKELLSKWKKGESIGFTATAHLKSKGLIPRADGTKKKSQKYMGNGGMIEKLRAEEQAEYHNMFDPKDETKRKEIYDKYDKLITPLMKKVCIRSKGKGDFKTWVIIDATSPYSYATEIEFDDKEQAEKYADKKAFNIVSDFIEDDSKAKGGKLWIKDAIKNKGALRATAKRKGLIEGEEKLSMTDLHKLEKVGGKTAKRAHLAETLRGFKK